MSIIAKSKLSQLSFVHRALLFLLDMGFLWAFFHVFHSIRFEQSILQTKPFGLEFAIPFLYTALVLYTIDGYSFKRNMLGLDYASEHVFALISAGLLTVSTVYLLGLKPALEFGRGILPLTFMAFTLTSLLYRRAFARWIQNHLDGRNFLILGSGELARDVYRDCRKAGLKQNLRFVDINPDRINRNILDSSSPLIEGDPLWQLENLNGNHDAVVMAMDRRGMNKEVVEKLIECHFGHVPILSLDKFYEEYFHRVPSTVMHPALFLGPGFHFARQPIFENIKRMMDVGIASIALFLALPFFLVIPILIRMEGKGPVIFRQTRTGKNNKPFEVYKYRTMIQVPKEEGAACTKENDARITPLGKWLRATHLDEIPQFWNVMKGDMSIIGPRPEQTKLTQIYESQFACYRFRHLVKPGITGWSQVNVNYGFDFEDAIKKCEYDLYYIRHYSFKLDAAILLKTAKLMVFGKGR